MNVAKTDRRKTKRRRATRTALERACGGLAPPPPEARVQFEVAVAGFLHFIIRDEFALALDELCAAAELVECRVRVWRELERAARLMRLYPRAAALRRTFWAATAGRRAAPGRIPASNGQNY